MEGQLEPRQSAPPTDRGVRASDGERDRAIEVLRDAVAEGRLDSEEFSERTERVLAARTRQELEGVLSDLPVEELAPQPARTLPVREELVLETTSGSRKQNGRWVVPPRIVASCSSGSVQLDFTEAMCPHSDVVVEATCRSGSVKLTVPRGWAAVVKDVTTRSGSIKSKVAEVPDTSCPVLHVYGSVGSGSIKIRYPRRWFWLRSR